VRRPHRGRCYRLLPQLRQSTLPGLHAGSEWDALLRGCLASLISHPAIVGAKSGANPGLAAAIGIIPGLGAVYNAQYMKALIHVLRFRCIHRIGSAAITRIPLSKCRLSVWRLLLST